MIIGTVLLIDTEFLSAEVPPTDRVTWLNQGTHAFQILYVLYTELSLAQQSDAIMCINWKVQVL